MTTHILQPGKSIDTQELAEALPVGAVLYGRKWLNQFDSSREYVLVKAGEKDWRIWFEYEEQYRRYEKVDVDEYGRLVLVHYPIEYGIAVDISESNE